MMDVQLPQAAPAGISSSTNSQNAPRLGQGGIRRESAGSGKPFSSELRDARAAKEAHQEMGQSRTDHDEHCDEHKPAAASEETAPTSATQPSSCAMRDDHSCESTSEPAQQKSDTAAPAVANDVTTQSVLLALIAQPVVTANTPPPQTSSAEPANTAMESVMPPVMEDGTSLPVTAADSSKLPQVGGKEMMAGATDLTAAIPSGAVLSPAVDAKGQPVAPPEEDASLKSQAQPAAKELLDLQQEKPAFPLMGEEQPQASAKAETTAQPVALPSEPRPEMPQPHEVVKALTDEPDRRPDENRTIAMERPVAKQEAPEPKEDLTPRQMAATSQAWQESANQERENGMEWSGRDHGERPSADQVLAHSAMTETSAPTTPSNPTLAVNSVDQRAFSSAPSAKIPTDAHPAVPVPPVQPTDWMPGTSAGQTKSMVLELSQADLGRVNIRVAVNQDVVHTHFSSDRSDMGQYLQNGQDKLQSALQTSGLDLGRFQVDIDRQSAGRSFQQPASQGRSNGHSPQGESQNQGQGREEFTRDNAPRRGMLNLVA